MRPTTPHRPLLCLLVTVSLLVAGCGRDLGPLQAATALPTARPLPEFTLTAQDRTPLTRETLRGRPTLLFFGFASCADVCPTTLTTLSGAVRQLTDLEANRRPRILFVSVDPARDTPAVLADYVQHFGPDVQATTGAAADLVRLTQAVGAHFQVPDRADPAAGYAVEHSAQVYVLDHEARFIAVFSPPLEATVMAGDLRRLLSH